MPRVPTVTPVSFGYRTVLVETGRGSVTQRCIDRLCCRVSSTLTLHVTSKLRWHIKGKSDVTVLPLAAVSAHAREHPECVFELSIPTNPETASLGRAF